MSCKCGARTFQGHLKKSQSGQYKSAHVYTGHYWGPTDG